MSDWKGRTCLKVLLQLLMIIFCHINCSCRFLKKKQQCFVVVIFLWNVFDLFDLFWKKKEKIFKWEKKNISTQCSTYGESSFFIIEALAWNGLRSHNLVEENNINWNSWLHCINWRNKSFSCLNFSVSSHTLLN